MIATSVPLRERYDDAVGLGQPTPGERGAGSMIRVLLVDGEPSLANRVKMALHYEGWVVEIAHNVRDAVAKVAEMEPDVLVLDVRLPGADGWQLLQRIRETRRYTPTLVLADRDSVTCRMSGAVGGADDYMSKPFSSEELVARLRGLLRRASQLAPVADEMLTVGDLELNSVSREVTRAGEPISLTVTEFELLRYLMRNPCRAIRRNEIVDRVWSYGFGGKPTIVDLYISYLRKKIDTGREPTIHTVRGVGYMLRPAVRRAETYDVRVGTSHAPW